MHPCIHASMYLFDYASMHLCIYASMHLCICASVSRPRQARPKILECISLSIYIYTYIYIYIYANLSRVSSA